MSDLENMQNDDFETKSKKTKDFWLFLIFVDVLALAFFGFMIYQALSVKFSAPEPVKAIQPKDMPQEAVLATPKTPEKHTPLTPAVRPEGAQVGAQAATKTPADEPVEPVIAPPQAAATPAPAVAENQPKIEPNLPKIEPRQSVIVEPSKSSKTRSVTFKFFDGGDKVQIASGFTMAKPQNLKKDKDGVWSGTFIIYPGEYKYIFIVDGRNTLDPYAEVKDGRSLVVVK
ncbi:hypothetical protein Dip510_000169 [Elusimicrobium posterum]|uniref:hypothetical protein n=1 Tax=Elusimicrobium posterum TaxID=3116653 RepID=UPI003C723857